MIHTASQNDHCIWSRSSLARTMSKYSWSTSSALRPSISRTFCSFICRLLSIFSASTFILSAFSLVPELLLSICLHCPTDERPACLCSMQFLQRGLSVLLPTLGECIFSSSLALLSLLLSFLLGISFSSYKQRNPFDRMNSACSCSSSRRSCCFCLRYSSSSINLSIFSLFPSSTSGTKFFLTCYENCLIFSALIRLQSTDSCTLEYYWCIGLLYETWYAYVALLSLLSLSRMSSFSLSDLMKDL